MKNNIKDNIFGRDFLLLWQGQFVSAIGDSLYGIALGFWILKVTGSTVHMGLIMALTVLPRVLLSPFAGILIDITNRKLFIILCDVVRGLVVGSIALAAYNGNIEIWMVYTSAIIIGACTAYFNPGILTAIPDLIKEENLMQANSMMGIAANFSGIIGNAIGGFIFSFFGAPLLFAVNSFSFIFSAGSEVFIRLPSRKKQKNELAVEIVSSFKFLFSETGIKLLTISSIIINFFGSLCFFLLLPLCEKSESLGPNIYGLSVAAFMLGIFAGMVILTTVKVNSKHRPLLFLVAMIIFSVSIACVPIWQVSFSVIFFQFLAGLANAALLTIIRTTIQIIVPEEKRGKIFSLFEGFWTLLMPLAFIAGGFFADKYDPKVIYMTSAVLMGLSLLPLMSFPSFLEVLLKTYENES